MLCRGEKPPKPSSKNEEENHKDQLIKILQTQWELRKKIEKYARLPSLYGYIEKELKCINKKTSEPYWETLEENPEDFV